MSFFANLFNNIVSQVSINTIASIVTVLCAVAGLIVFIRHHQSSAGEKWKTIGIVSLIVVLVVAFFLWPKTSSTQVPKSKQWSLIYTYYNHNNPDDFILADIAWSPDSTRIASADAMGAVRVWDATTGKTYIRHTVPTPTWFGIIVAWSPNGRYIAAANHFQVFIWNAVTGNTLFTINVRKISLYPLLPLEIAWSPNSRYIALTDAGTVHVFDITTGQDILTYTDFLKSSSVLVEGMAWAPNGQDIASWYSDGTIEVWNVDYAFNLGSLLLTHSSQSGQIDDLSWSPDGQDIASGYRNGTVQIWNAFSGKSANTLGNVSLVCPPSHNGVWSVAWSPDGKSLAYVCISDGVDDVVHIWNANLQQFALYPGEDGKWAPNGKFYAILFNDAVQVYQVG